MCEHEVPDIQVTGVYIRNTHLHTHTPAHTQPDIKTHTCEAREKLPELVHSLATGPQLLLADLREQSSCFNGL